MALKLRLIHREVIHIGDNIKITNSGGNASIEIEAPVELDIKRWRDGVAQTRNADKGQNLSPEQQRKAALAKFKRRNT